MVSAEAAPFAKTGGLADVVGALPKALVELGEEVGVVLPRYGAVTLTEPAPAGMTPAVVTSSADISMPRSADSPGAGRGDVQGGGVATTMGKNWTGAERIWHEMPITLGHYSFTASIDEIRREGVRFFFVDCPPLFARDGIYNERGVDYADNPLRFALLNQAALGIARHIFRPQIFHCHDWPASLLAPYLKETFAGDPTFFNTRCVLTIHNLGYQGNFPPTILEDLGLDRNLFQPEGLEFWGQVSFLKAGIVWADAITTVSPTYAREIQTEEYGYGFDGVLRPRAEKICGILNGVDYSEWDPRTDRHIAARYSDEDLEGKRFCKLALQGEMGLPVDQDRPLFGIVSRLAHQKGFDLLESVAPMLLKENVAMVVLGQGDPQIEAMFQTLARAFPEQVAVRTGYSEGLSHRIEAGTDMFLMPSRYEPCGLNQMYSLRYGTVPVVRATGGLADTVEPSTGFRFAPYTPEALYGATRDALEAWRNPAAWQKRMKTGMRKDFSWRSSAAEYQRLYRRLLESGQARVIHRV